MIINIILTAIIVLIIAAAAIYVIKEKKSGAKCIGCPSAKECGKSCCSCSVENNTTE